MKEASGTCPTCHRDSLELKSVFLSFHLLIDVTDHTGTLHACSLTGGVAEETLGCTVSSRKERVFRNNSRLNSLPPNIGYFSGHLIEIKSLIKRSGGKVSLDGNTHCFSEEIIARLPITANLAAGNSVGGCWLQWRKTFSVVTVGRTAHWGVPIGGETEGGFGNATSCAKWARCSQRHGGLHRDGSRYLGACGLDDTHVFFMVRTCSWSLPINLGPKWFLVCEGEFSRLSHLTPFRGFLQSLSDLSSI